MSSPATSSTRASSSLLSRSPPFSRLPNEIWVHITNEVVPLVVDSRTYTSRQTIISSLSLVSKYFLRIMRPILFSAVRISSRRRFRAWGQGRKKVASVLIRQLFIDFEFSKGPAPNFDDYVHLHSTLSKLVVTGFKEVLDLSGLTALTNLSTLHLSDIVVTASQPSPLASVDLLNLYGVTSPSLRSTFNPVNFPALRAFAWYDFDVSQKEVEKVFNSLEPQLEVILVDEASVSDDLAVKLDNKTLFDLAYYYRDDLPSVQFLRLAWRNYTLVELSDDSDDSHDSFDSSEENALHSFHLLAGTISEARQQSRSTPALIYLPLVMKEHFVAQEEERAVDLYNVCSQSDIELVFEEQPSDRQVDCGVSPDFWKRVKKRNALEKLDQ